MTRIGPLHLGHSSGSAAPVLPARTTALGRGCVKTRKNDGLSDSFPTDARVFSPCASTCECENRRFDALFPLTKSALAFSHSLDPKRTFDRLVAPPARSTCSVTESAPSTVGVIDRASDSAEGAFRGGTNQRPGGAGSLPRIFSSVSAIERSRRSLFEGPSISIPTGNPFFVNAIGSETPGTPATAFASVFRM
jgi:hypothetical protein